MSKANFVFALLLLVACGGQPAEQAAAPAEPAAPTEPAAPAAPAPAPAPEPAPAPAAAEEKAAEPAPAPAAADEKAAPAPTADKPVGGSSTKTAEPSAKKPAAAKEEPAAPAPEAKAAAPAPAASAGPCGEEGQPMCPLQAFMERFVQKPMEDGDLAAVAKGLERAAKLAPDPSWNAGGATGWAGIAQAGADAANKGDEAAAKQTCKSCHKAFRSKYKAEFRSKPL